MSVNAAPVRDPDGVVVGGVAIFTDVTERKTLEQEKEAFLAAITHDLRSPLSAIKATAQLLERQAATGPIPQERLGARLRRINEGADRLDRQLTELQDIARLRTGQAIELTRSRVDLIALVQGAAARHQTNSEDHELSVALGQLGGNDLVGNWDEGRLDRVLDNLLGNAVKFSPKGGPVKLTLALESGDSPSRSWAVMRLSDQGMGIPADDLPHVFDWFRRASNARGQIAGTGIGLAAARQIVEMHGGTLSVQSKEGEGCTFTCRLPLGPSTPPEAA